MKQSMKSRDVLPKSVPGVGCVMQGWGVSCRGGGGSYRGGLCHAGVGWVTQGWGRVGHTGVG